LLGATVGLLTAPAVAQAGSWSALWLFPLLGLSGLFLGAVLRQWLAHRCSHLTSSPTSGKLAVVIPARNEVTTIGDVIARIPRRNLRSQGWYTHVIVVDDGSTDETARVAQKAGADVVCRHGSRRGLGAALRTGLGAARENHAAAAVYLDADGEYDPGQIPAIMGPITKGQADYVLGSRFAGARRGMQWRRSLGNRLFTALTVALSGCRMSDAQTGFRAFSQAALWQAEIIHDYNYAQVLTLDLLRKGARLTEVPIDYTVRRHGRSFIRGPEYCRRVIPAIVREMLAD
jgi:glycosyltransferase involved in cell wall biosynthesis